MSTFVNLGVVSEEARAAIDVIGNLFNEFFCKEWLITVNRVLSFGKQKPWKQNDGKHIAWKYIAWKVVQMKEVWYFINHLKKNSFDQHLKKTRTEEWQEMPYYNIYWMTKIKIGKNWNRRREKRSYERTRKKNRKWRRGLRTDIELSKKSSNTVNMVGKHTINMHRGTMAKRMAISWQKEILRIRSYCSKG